MDKLRLKLLSDIMGHLQDSQAGELKSLLDSLNKPSSEKLDVTDPLKSMEKDPDLETIELKSGKPRGIAIEKVSVLEKPKAGYDEKVDEAISDQDTDLEKRKKLLPGEEEMTDEELEELLKRL